MRKKRFFASVLASALVLGSLTLPENIRFGGLNFGTFYAQAADVVDSGTCGDNLTWTLDEDGVLTISGTGEMTDFTYYNPENVSPWRNYKENIISVEIESGVTSIGEYAFSGCANLTSVELSYGVTSIGISAFYGCTNLTSIDIPESVSDIGEYAFSKCTSLTSIKIPANVTIINNETFSNCYALTDVKISNGVTVIDTYAFAWCTGLTSIDIPNSVSDIGTSAFYECTGITSIKIPDSVTSIGNCAFYSCTNLTSVSITENVTYIGEGVFSGCTGLVADENGFIILDGILIDYCGSDTDVIIPDGVVTITAYAFDSSNILSVTFPESVTTIEHRAFQDCKYLTSIVLPENIISVAEYAFEDCSALTSLTVPAGINEISSFYYCYNLSDIYYSGSASDWEDLVSDIYATSYLHYATIHYSNIETEYDIGDVNQNGSIDYLDAMLVLRYDAELDTLTDEQLALADVNSDGSVDSLDAILILRYDAGLIEEF